MISKKKVRKSIRKSHPFAFIQCSGFVVIENEKLITINLETLRVKANVKIFIFTSYLIHIPKEY